MNWVYVSTFIIQPLLIIILPSIVMVYLLRSLKIKLVSRIVIATIIVIILTVVYLLLNISVSI